ncbi:MAG TPA: extracellular solute-binding protein [Acidimicrobiales bacterium]|nr:extracellular solute-binding protein [Acidimicrobiales bacterium]
MHRTETWGRRGRPAVVAALVAALAVLATACSSGRDPAAETTILRVRMTDDWVTPPFVAAVRAFEQAHPDVRVDVSKAPISHMLDDVRTAIRNGEPPDVVQAHAFSAAAQGLAQPLDDLWAKKKPLKTSDFLAGAIDDVTWGKRLYGVPLDTNALFLLYDRDQFAAANVTPPADGSGFSFSSFETAARALTSPDGSRRALAIPTSTWWTYGWIRANGGDVLATGPDGKVHLTFDDPKTVAALDYLRRLVAAGLAFAPGAADSHSTDAFALFRSGNSSTLASGSWDLTTVTKDDAGKARYASMPLPTGLPGKNGSVMGGSSMFVPNGSKHRELAFQFMANLISDPFALRLAKEQGRLPVRTALYKDPYFQSPDLTAVRTQLTGASAFKLSAFPGPHDIFASAIDQILRENKEAGPVMADAQQRAQPLLPNSP